MGETGNSVNHHYSGGEARADNAVTTPQSSASTHGHGGNEGAAPPANFARPPPTGGNYEIRQQDHHYYDACREEGCRNAAPPAYDRLEASPQRSTSVHFPSGGNRPCEGQWNPNSPVVLSDGTTRLLSESEARAVLAGMGLAGAVQQEN